MVQENIYKAIEAKEKLQKMNDNMVNQGVPKEKRRQVIISALEEMKRKTLADDKEN